MHMENMVLGIAFGTAVSVLKNEHIAGYKGTYNHIKLEDIEDGEPKDFPVKGNRFAQVSSDNFEKIPGAPVAYWVSEKVIRDFEEKSVGDYCQPRQGFATGENERFLRFWQEVKYCKINFNAQNGKKNIGKWFPCNKGGEYRKWYGNNNRVVNWENDGFEMKNYDGSVIRNPKYYFRNGITWSTLGSSKLSMRYSPAGFLFESKGSVCFFNDEDELLYILGMLNSKVADEMLLILSPTIDYHEGPIGRIPAIMRDECKNKADETVKNSIEISKYDYDSFELSWEFRKHPLI